MSDEPNWRIVNFRVPAHERRAIGDAASAVGVSMSELLRQLTLPRVHEMLEDKTNETETAAMDLAAE